jgi:eukaryotic-like serine/threonine-protein kinase
VIERAVHRFAEGDDSNAGPTSLVSSHRACEPGARVGKETLVAGRFRLDSLAGRGGMGEVWRAVDLQTSARVALKRMLDAEGEGDRFARECLLLENVKHEALVGHLAHGVDEGIPWLAMQWIEGETLSSRLGREGLALGQTLMLASRIAGALSALHRQGIVHRDLKPANVMLPAGRPEDALLLDLGVARTNTAVPTLTATNLILGTVGYMAPEQALSGHSVTPRADVFALGCILFECLTGAPVYPGDRPIEMLARLLSDAPRRARDLRSDVPEALDSLLASMLSREIDRRPRDGGAVLAALEALEVPEAAMRLTAPRVVAPLTNDERALALAAVVVLGPVDDRATPSPEPMDRVRAAAEKGGGEAIELDPRTALVIAEARGTVADRASNVAVLTRAVVAAEPSARVGLAAGLAKSSARVPVGELLERATRLARCANAGTITVDTVVRDLLDARFEIDEAGLLGQARAIEAGRRVMGKLVPFVGREKDMAVLEATVAESIAESASRALLVIARPGTGKSRLAQEFAEARLRRRDDITVLQVRAESASAGTVHSVMRGLVRAAIGLGPHPAAEDHEVLRGHVRSLPEVEAPERLADFLGDLAGTPRHDEPGMELASARGDAELMSRWLRRTVREWLGAETARKPVVLMIEDLHWSDEATIVHLGEALRALADRPLVVIALARPEVSALFREPWRNLTELRLGGLGPRASERIARALLGADADRGVIARVIERADGNPYFLEELVRFVAEGRGDTLPVNVLAVLHARYAELEPELRRVLRAASVLGERFVPEGVAAVAGTRVESLRGTFDALIAVELLDRTEEGFAFRHALARDATYATFAESDRRAAHERAANWMEQQPGPSPRAMVAHLEAAGAIDRALPWLVAAAVQSMEMGADDEAFALAEKGLSLGAAGIDGGRLYAIRAARSFYNSEYAEAVSSGRHAMERLPTTHPDWFLAAGATVFASSSIGDLASGAEVIGAWLANPPVVQGGRVAYLAQFATVVGLVTGGMMDQASAVLAATTPPRPGTIGEPYVELAYATIAEYRAGRLGELLSRARRAREVAARNGDEGCVAIADVLLWAAKVFCVAPESGLAELNALIEHNANVAIRIAFDWFAAYCAALEARADPRRLAALQRCASTPNILTAEKSQVLVEVELVRLNRTDELQVELSRRTPVLGFARTHAAVCRALVSLERNDPERALRELDAAEELARSSAIAWTWELLHLCRARALVGLGRAGEAIASVQAGLARVSYTLEGIDDELRAGVEAHVDVVRKLRALAGRLGVTPPVEPAPTPAGQG